MDILDPYLNHFGINKIVFFHLRYIKGFVYNIQTCSNNFTMHFERRMVMKKINIVKISLDIAMTLVFVLLYNKGAVSGLSFHEIAGLCVGGVFIVHIALNWRWVKQVTINMLKKKLAFKTRIGYVVDVLLLFSIAYIIISGIMISKVLFPNINIGDRMFFQSTHISVAYFALLLVGIHLGLHWDWAMNTFKKIFRISQAKPILNYAAKALMIVVLISGIYSMYSTNYFKRLPIVSSTSNGGHTIGMDRGNNNSMTAPNGAPNGNGGARDFTSHDNGFKGGEKGAGNGNIVIILTTYLGIIGVFAIITFYLEKLLLRLKRKNKSAYSLS